MVHVVGSAAAAGRGPLGTESHELGDQHRPRLVVPDARVVGDAGAVVQRDRIALGVESTPQVDGKGGTLGVPRGLFVTRPLHAHGAAELLRQEGGLEARVVGSRAAVQLRPVHPDHAHAVRRHVEELGDPGAVAVRLHVVRVDRHLAVGRIGQGVRGTDGGVSLERHVVGGLYDRRRAGQRRLRIALGPRGRTAAARRRHRIRAPHVVEQVVGAREGRRRRLLPLHHEPVRRLDGLLLALAHHRDVVAPAHRADESGKAAHRRLVDADQRRAHHRGPHVARVHHARELHVDRPFERRVHLAGDVVPGDRLPDQLEVLDGLHARDPGGRVDVAAGQRDVEAASADQLPVRHHSRAIGPHRDYAITHVEFAHGDAKALRGHLEQHPPPFRRHAAGHHRITLDRVGPSRSALIDSLVGAAHDEGGHVVGDVELVAHDLARGRPGALAAVGLADVEGGGAVLVDDQPGVELEEIGVGVEGRLARVGGGGPAAHAGRAQAGETEDEEPRGLEEVAAGGGAVPGREGAVNVGGELALVRPGSRAWLVRPLAAHRSAPPSAITAAARFTAAWIR